MAEAHPQTVPIFSEMQVSALVSAHAAEIVQPNVQLSQVESEAMEVDAPQENIAPLIGSGPSDTLVVPSNDVEVLTENAHSDEENLPPNYPPDPYPIPYSYDAHGYISALPSGKPHVEVENGHEDDGDEGTDEEDYEEDHDENEDNGSDLSDGDVLAEDMEDALSIRTDWFKGSYYHASLQPNAPNPCLQISGLGLVGLPLSERDAKWVISAATLAPFGHGERTVVDKNVRDTWEIEPASLTFGNPEWSKFINGTVRQHVCQSLGVEVAKFPPRLELYKLLLYEQGSHFLPHQDTQKADGMFATVVVVLPSAYTGGEVVVQHASVSKVLDYAPNSMISTAVLAWYTDVKHEVKPITSGYRLALAYNLLAPAKSNRAHARVIHTARPGVPQPILPKVDEDTELLRKVLRKWKFDRYSDVPDPSVIAHVLDHQYSAANLQQGIHALKGADLYRVTFIRDVAQELGFSVGLARLSRHDSGYAEDDGGGYYKRGRYYDEDSEDEREDTPPMAEVTDTTTYIEGLVDLEGDSMMSFGKVEIENESLLPKDYFEDASPDKTDYEGYMGNGAGGLEYWYHRTVLFIVHEYDVDNVCFKVGGISYALTKLKNASTPPTDDDRSWASRVAARPESLNAQQAAAMLRLASTWKDAGFWDKIMRSPACTLQALEQTLLVESWHAFSFDKVKRRFEDVLVRSRPLAAQVAFLNDIQARASPEERNAVCGWCKQQLERLVVAYSAADLQDIPTMAALVLELGSPLFSEKVVPNLAKIPDTYGFLIAFGKGLRASCEAILTTDGQPLLDSSSDVNLEAAGSSSVVALTPAASTPPSSLPATAPNSVDALIEKCLQTAASQWTGPTNVPYYYRNNSQTVKVDRIVEVMQQALEINNLEICRTLVLNILKTQGTVAEKFDQIYRPLIPRLRPVLQAKNRDIFDSPFVDFYQIIIGTYLRETLGKKAPGTNAKLRKIGCTCIDCQQLDNFMLDPHRSNQLFRLVKNRRLHLERQIAGARDICTYRTINYGSPHGVEVTKRPEIVAASSWEYKQREAKKFLLSIGPDDLISRIMGPRYVDVTAALNGTRLFGAISTGLNPPLDLTRSAPSASSSNSVGNANAAATNGNAGAGSDNNQVAGQKRKSRPAPTRPIVQLDTIDLTGLDSD